LIRTILTDAQWERIAPLLPGKEGDPGRSGGDNRAALEGMLWIVRTGAPWRDLPECFGNEYALIDGTIMKVHRHATGAKGGLSIRPSASRAEA
jgi:hypothetical protein